MPKEITDKLREGLPSKIYLFAYNGPLSGYEIAKRVYNIQPLSIPPTSKVYGWTKKMKADGLLSKTDEGYISNAEPLLIEIIKNLEAQNITLTDAEKSLVFKMVDSCPFRAVTQFTRLKSKTDGDVNAADFLIELVGMLSIIIYAQGGDRLNRFFGGTLDEKKLELLGTASIEQEKIKEIIKKLEKETKDDINMLLVLLIQCCYFSKDLTEKLCMLSPFSPLFSLFLDGNAFKLLELWRKRVNSQEKPINIDAWKVGQSLERGS